MSKDRDEPASNAQPADRRPRGVVSLLGQRAEAGEEPPPGGAAALERDAVSGERPSRAAGSGPDPLRSAHTAFRDLEAPRGDHDPERAREVCAAITRGALRDFAPALVLLPAASRMRAQAVIAYARTLLDFARDRSLEGERLAQINRFEFELEAALGGEPTGQPVFVQLAALERGEPWPRHAFDTLASIARSRVSVGVPSRPLAAEEQRGRLTQAILLALLSEPPAPELLPLGAAVLRAGSLLGWHEALWFHRPDLGLGQDEAPSPRFAEAVAAEERAIREALEDTKGAIATLAERYRPAVRYVRLTAAALARRAAAAPASPTPPRLPLAERIWLLLRARLGSRVISIA
jgi:phytoene/squalene synthetase